MIIHKILGAAMIIIPLGIVLWRAEPETKREILHTLAVITLVLSGVFGLVLLLTGCTTTKPVEVPVPVACVQPKLPVEPHYPIKDLKIGDSPATVVKAYVATAAGQHDYIERVKYIYAGDK